MTRAGRDDHRERALRRVPHSRGTQDIRAEPRRARHHEPRVHRRRRQPHRRQHLPQRVALAARRPAQRGFAPLVHMCSLAAARLVSVSVSVFYSCCAGRGLQAESRRSSASAART